MSVHSTGSCWAAHPNTGTAAAGGRPGFSPTQEQNSDGAPCGAPFVIAVSAALSPRHVAGRPEHPNPRRSMRGT